MLRKRVGSTEDINRRQEEWFDEHPSLHNWIIRATNLNYDQAKALENEYIARGYDGSPGGPRRAGYVYSVYTFEYFD